MKPPGLVFICLGNSCRSIMAEALARHHFQERVTVGSAGISPLGFVARETLQVLAEIGVPLAGLRSKGLEDLEFSRYHWAVNLTDYSLESLLPSTFPGRVLNRPVADPYGRNLEHYRRTREVLQRLIIRELQPILLPSAGQ